MKEIDPVALEQCLSMFQKEGSTPKDVWHPDFGWVLVDGQPTGKFEEFIKMAGKKK